MNPDGTRAVVYPRMNANEREYNPHDFFDLSPLIRVHWRPFAVESFENLAPRFMVQTRVQFLEVFPLHEPDRTQAIY